MRHILDIVIDEINNEPNFKIENIEYKQDCVIIDVDMTEKKRTREVYKNEEERILGNRATKTHYMLNKPWFCNICKNNKDYKLTGKFCHIKTKKHQRNIEKYETMNKNKKEIE